ncbi:unnamed protein product, partial [Urochloa humidicola]
SLKKRQKGALSIQKNFRCWKKQKEFLNLRENVIKIQAQVRAHQERRKYKELLQSVPWYGKGIGSQVLNSEGMSIDEVMEVDVANVFQKLTVETDEAVSMVIEA